MDKSYSGSIALTKLKHVLMEAEGQNGPIKGLFIPSEPITILVPLLLRDKLLPKRSSLFIPEIVSPNFVK